MRYSLEQIEFKGEKKFLSNMFKTNILFNDTFGIEIEGIEPDNKIYKSSEHLYQALKSKNKLWHSIIRNIERPEETKNLSRKKIKTLLANNKTTFLLREDWDFVKIDIMRMILFLKFSQNAELKEKLIQINGQIEERNCWNDRFWGTVNGIGENWLGKILMEIREKLRK
jgi:ribA/ribD-fused uncharacterized protein